MQRAYKDLIKLYADREFTGKSIALDNVSHSRIRELDILGETAEIGEGEKSPDNPFTLVGAVSPAVTVNGQTLPMVGRNLYEPVAENFSDLSDDLGINEGGYIYLKNAIPTVSTRTHLMFSFKKNDVFKPNTRYTLVTEIEDIDKTGSVIVSPISNAMNNSFFNNTILVSSNKGIFKNRIVSIPDFYGRAIAIRGLIRLDPGASLTSLKFRISIYRADNIDLDTFVYEPYKDTFELNSVGDIADSYNPLTGEYVQRVGKLVLDGTEDWTENNKYEDTNISIRFVSTIIQNLVKPAVGNDIVANIKCSHYVEKTTQILGSNYLEGVAVSSSGGLSIRDFFEDAAGFKSFLAAQYEAGTPVTVFYELAEPITTIINQTELKANIPDTTISLTEANNLGSIRAVLQTKGE